MHTRALHAHSASERRGNGLFLLLCCALGPLPPLRRHLLSTAQRVPLSRQFRQLHRGVCIQGTAEVRSEAEHKRDAPGTSSPGVIQVSGSGRLAHGLEQTAGKRKTDLLGIVLKRRAASGEVSKVHAFVRLLPAGCVIARDCDVTGPVGARSLTFRERLTSGSVSLNLFYSVLLN